jgi:predicted O-methyltransferase YrrM
VFVEALHLFAGQLQSSWLRLSDHWHSWRIAGASGYVFTEDYSKPFRPLWTQHLAELKDREYVSLLEIGSFEGRSAIWFLENILTHPTATLTCVDAFVRPGSEPRFDHNLRVSGLSAKVNKLKGKSEELLSTLTPGSFDAIYIDGCHKALNVLMDAMASWILLKSKGIVIFDDYGWELQRPPLARPRMAIDLFLNVLQDEIVLLHRGYQIIVRKA